VLWSKPSPEDHIIEIVGIGGLDHEAAIRSNMSTGDHLLENVDDYLTLWQRLLFGTGQQDQTFSVRRYGHQY